MAAGDPTAGLRGLLDSDESRLHTALPPDCSRLTAVALARLGRRPRVVDVLPDGPVDVLKLDVQGAELLVLTGAGRTLARTAVVHCEVEFAPLYLEQSLYQDVATELAQHGFVLVDLLVSLRYSWLVPNGTRAPDRLLWADAIFARTGGGPDTQALLAAAVYRKPTWAEHMLQRRHNASGD